MRLPTVASVANVGVKMLLFGRRRQDLTPAEFRDYYENHHIPLLKSVFGDAFPSSHKRTYVLRDEPDYMARVVLGEQADFQYDSLSILTWRDQQHFDAQFAIYMNDTVGGIIKEDEAKFTEWGKAVLVAI